MSDRKYKQRGYQDDDRPREPRREGPAGPRPEREGPRGRGLGAPQREVFRCRDCGAENVVSAALAFDSACHQCRAPLHVCVNCAHFDTSARNECRKPIPARMPSKTKANTCELYSPKIALETDGGRSDHPKDPRAAFDALFRS
jgi:hypothetical protein